MRLILHMVVGDIAQAEELGETLARQYSFAELPSANRLEHVPRAANLGPVAGREVLIPQLSTVARTATIERGLAFAVTLAVDGAPLSDPLYQLFDMACQTFEYHKY